MSEGENTDRQDTESKRNSASNGLRALSMPWASSNPYQQRLAKSLSNLGIQTIQGPGKAHFLPQIFSANPDIIHLHWPHPFYSSSIEDLHPLNLLFRSYARFITFFIELTWVVRSGSAGLVWTVHNVEAHEQQHPALDNAARHILARLSDVIVVHSEHARKQVIERWKIRDTHKIICIPHANYIGCYPDHCTRDESRRRLGIEDDEFVYLFLGRIRSYKGLDELLDAFERTSTLRPSRLIVAGQVPETEFGRRLTRRAKQVANVDLRPEFIADEELQYYFRAADVVVLPYRKILTSGSALLAMSFSCPIIAPDFGHLKEIIPEDCSLLYPSRKLGELSQMMQRAWDLSDRLDDFGHAHRERAEQYRWSEVGKLTAACYRRAARKPNEC